MLKFHLMMVTMVLNINHNYLFTNFMVINQ